MVAETSYHGKWRRSARSASVRLCALSSAHHDACHDQRSSIAAKGLTGEGYKGHVFWDTEVFLLPFHLFSDRMVAEVYCVIAGTTCQARRRKRDATAGRARYFRGKARAAAKKRRRNCCDQHSHRAAVKWPRRRRNIIWWPISPGRLFNTGMMDESFIAHEGMALLLETAKFWISRAVG